MSALQVLCETVTPLAAIQQLPEIAAFGLQHSSVSSSLSLNLILCFTCVCLSGIITCACLPVFCLHMSTNVLPAS